MPIRYLQDLLLSYNAKLITHNLLLITFMVPVGNTPLIKLEHLTEPDSADVYIKFEGANMTGSMKDRMALSMIEGAERRGELSKGGTVVEYTGGSTGSSLAMVCAAKGYKAHFISSDAFAKEKLQTMLAFGATLELIPTEGGKITPALTRQGIERVKELATEPNTFWTDQFNNTDNRSAYHKMADEIIDVLGTGIDEFIMAVGTGGCYSGNAERLKERIPGIRCIPVEPAASRALSGLQATGGHRLEGIGIGFITTISRLDLASEIVAVTDEDAFATVRVLATKEGIFGGASSGANVWAALQRAKILGKGKKVVTVVCDSGLKYLQGELYAPIP